MGPSQIKNILNDFPDATPVQCCSQIFWAWNQRQLYIARTSKSQVWVKKPKIGMAPTLLLKPREWIFH